MTSFLDAAYKVLRERREPLTPTELTNRAIQKGWLKTSGKTPAQTMKSKLSTNILQHGEQSLFMRTGKNLFALRDWDQKEYVADRYQKALLDEEVVVFPAESISTYIPGPGLHRQPLTSGRVLAQQLRPMSRRIAEADCSVIQLVSVFAVRYRGSFLTYKRSRRLPESRLHGEYSLIFGGHLNPDDIPSLFDLFDPDAEPFLTRELEEELTFPRESPPRLQFRGLLYDDRRPLSRQHLGIVYDVFAVTPKFRIAERGFLMEPKWEPVTKIRDRLDEFENWSELLLRAELAHTQFRP